jgi:hypothetical protein
LAKSYIGCRVILRLLCRSDECAGTPAARSIDDPYTLHSMRLLNPRQRLIGFIFFGSTGGIPAHLLHDGKTSWVGLLPSGRVNVKIAVKST